MLGFALIHTLFRLYYFGFKGSILAEEDAMSPVLGLFNSER
jgi:hypothetical protein